MKSLLFFIVVLSLIGCGDGSAKQTSSQFPQSQSTFDRIVLTNEIRCGYSLWPLAFDREPNRGNFSGAFFEITEEIAKRSGLKIIWEEEIPIGDAALALNSNKIDLFCSGIWPSSMRAKFMTFSNAAFYNVTTAYVSADSPYRTADDLLQNANKLTFGTIDGEMSERLQAAYFPTSKTFSLSKESDGPALLLAIATNKADLTITDRTVAHLYAQKNPNSIREIESAQPFAVFGDMYAMSKGEQKLKDFLDVSIEDLKNTGFINKVLTKYDPSGKLLVAEKPAF